MTMDPNNLHREKMSVKLGPSPRASSVNVSKSMKGNKAKDTKPELELRKLLYSYGLLGYRLNLKTIPGRPDICYTKRKIAIFVNGCYWHRCPYCRLHLPKTNRSFWKKKFMRNKERDRLKTQKLRKMGWTVITVWECQINKRLDATVQRILKSFER